MIDIQWRKRCVKISSIFMFLFSLNSWLNVVIYIGIDTFESLSVHASFFSFFTFFLHELALPDSSISLLILWEHTFNFDETLFTFKSIWEDRGFRFFKLRKKRFLVALLLQWSRDFGCNV